MIHARFAHFHGRVYEELPPCCVCCGEQTDVVIKKQFSRISSWAIGSLIFGLLGVFVFLLIYSMTERKVRIDLPVCEKHKQPWFYKSFFGILLAIQLFGILPLSLIMDLTNAVDTELFPFLMIAWFIGFAFFVSAYVVNHSRSIHYVWMTKDEIRLTKLSPVFVRQLKLARKQRKEERSLRRRREMEHETLPVAKPVKASVEASKIERECTYCGAGINDRNKSRLCMACRDRFDEWLTSE